MKYQAGILRHRVTIQALAESADAYFEATDAPEDLDQVRAAVLPPRRQISGETEYAEALQGKRIHLVVMRYWRPGLTRDHQLVLEGRVLHIIQIVDVEERHRWLEVSCWEDV